MACDSRLEIPAGMLDGSGNFAGKAASEMKEETGIVVKDGDMIDLTEMVQGGAGHKGVWLSPGGSDEFMRFFLYRKAWPQADIEALEGKLTGEFEFASHLPRSFLETSRISLAVLAIVR